jgi:RNA polymerase sigma-70 factor (ECF subfamily)
MGMPQSRVGSLCPTEVRMPMEVADDAQTSPTLLGRLGQEPTNQAAWEEFVERYGRRIYAWCRQWGLQDADAQDVTQMVLTRLAQRLRTFAYDSSGSFRGWLRTLTHHAWCDFVAARERPGRGSGDSAVESCLHTVEARADLLAVLEEAFDRELFDEASARVRLRVSPRIWDAFRLTALEGQSGAEAAAQLGMQIAAVFKAKSRVQRLLQEEVRKLEGDPT